MLEELPLKYLYFFTIGSIGFSALTIWLWMLADCVANEPENELDRSVWIPFLIVTAWVGAAAYLVIRRPRRRRLYGR